MRAARQERSAIKYEFHSWFGIVGTLLIPEAILLPARRMLASLISLHSNDLSGSARTFWEDAAFWSVWPTAAVALALQI